jgi:hypothetical protein
MTGGGMDGDGVLVIGLRSLNDSGISGVATSRGWATRRRSPSTWART